MLGRAVATRRKLKLGDRFSIGEITVTVAAIYACENRVEENYVYTHLAFLQRRHRENLVGTVTQFEVLVADDANAETPAVTPTPSTSMAASVPTTAFSREKRRSRSSPNDKASRMMKQK